MFQFTDRSLTPTRAAAKFAAEAFESPREVNLNLFSGRWINSNYEGEFALCGGRKVYTIACDPTGTWAITPTNRQI